MKLSEELIKHRLLKEENLRSRLRLESKEGIDIVPHHYSYYIV